MYKEVSHDISVSVSPDYDSERSLPEKSYYFFLYTVTITNHGQDDVQLLDRHWIINDGNGNSEEVKGDGVIGESPIIAPGESYTYTSACPLTTKTGNMRGTYGIIRNSQRLRISIPAFFLRTPDTFH